jgi:hypothetical protein
MEVAQKTFELNNNIEVCFPVIHRLPVDVLNVSCPQTIDANDEIFRYNRDEQMELVKAEPWAKE